VTNVRLGGKSTGVRMQLDVRLPAGLMFLIMGVMLAGYGVAGDQSIYTRSLGININLIWGLVLIAAALCLLALSFRNRPRTNGDRSDHSRG
jgi:hypothetical protein